MADQSPQRRPPRRASAPDVAVTAAITAPTAAHPRALPSSVDVLKTPEARPRSSSPTPSVAATVRGTLAVTKPASATAIPRSTADRAPSWGISHATSTNPATDMANPQAAVCLAPSLVVSLPATGEATTEARVMGMKSSPASSGVRPRASPSHRALDAHSAIPLLALREGSRHQRERGRYERRPAYTLQEARNHQHPGRPRQPPKERGGEQGEPAHEQAPPAVEVA